MVDRRSRIINYRRVNFAQPLSNGVTMQSLLDDCLGHFPTRSDRTIWTGPDALDCLSSKKTSGVGTYCYVVGYTAGDMANAVAKAGVSSKLQVVAPPANSEFIDGAFAILVSGDNIFYCSENLRESSVVRWISDFIQKRSSSNNDDYDKGAKFVLSKHADDKILKRLAHEGIASIVLDGGLYEAERQYLGRKNKKDAPVGLKLLGQFANTVKILTAQDDELKVLHENENLFINLEIKFNRVRKGGELGQDRVQKIAKDLIGGDEGGFEIKTFSGNKIRHDELILKKPVNLRVHGKSFDYSHAWQELTNYQSELYEKRIIS